MIVDCTAYNGCDCTHPWQLKLRNGKDCLTAKFELLKIFPLCYYSIVVYMCIYDNNISGTVLPMFCLKTVAMTALFQPASWKPLWRYIITLTVLTIELCILLLSQCSIDCRKELSENILLVGGTATLTGFKWETVYWVHWHAEPLPTENDIQWNPA